MRDVFIDCGEHDVRYTDQRLALEIEISDDGETWQHLAESPLPPMVWRKIRVAVVKR